MRSHLSQWKRAARSPARAVGSMAVSVNTLTSRDANSPTDTHPAKQALALPATMSTGWHEPCSQSSQWNQLQRATTPSQV